jgi:hypothetical protein
LLRSEILAAFRTSDQIRSGTNDFGGRNGIAAFGALGVIKICGHVKIAPCRDVVPSLTCRYMKEIFIACHALV